MEVKELIEYIYEIWGFGIGTLFLVWITKLLIEVIF